MQGVITTYDSRKKEGRIQGEDGHIYYFGAKNLDKAEDEDYLMMDRKVEFNSIMDNEQPQAMQVVVLDKTDGSEDPFYSEPPSFVCQSADLDSGYDVLDRGLYRLERGERTEAKARARLIAECSKMGANAVVRYEVTTKLKNAFGYGYELFTAAGVPAVLGRPDPNGEVRKSELMHRIDQEQVKKAHNLIVNTRIGKMVLMGLGAILLIIFAIGFIATGGV